MLYWLQCHTLVVCNCIVILAFCFVILFIVLEKPFRY